ncbi:type II toxin-antitoxin system RelE/ParE family toxin [Enterococcus sp. 5H]|uniref:type II toxin-antitoxin system RelE/ParE family toxin n=1 Tax=Enterococcus sp. 5H TaxID=1229490 RepID=UPI002304B4E5|nr:type II toxin-antitoxin system RelE/ParE family toxin [Enterococcus sp. 5H]
MSNFSIAYSESFRLSLRECIREWSEEYFFTDEKISTFIQSIHKSIELTAVFPKMHENVASLYNFKVPTYRILIGTNYAIFYRINEQEKKILVGNIFHQKQMHITF